MNNVSGKIEKQYLLGISHWKKLRLKPFFPKTKLVFVDNLDGIENVTVWGNKIVKNINIKRIEDGFIRSVSLGVDFSQPYSLVIDKRGLYYDSRKESDLEYILNTYEFDNQILERANNIKNYLVQNKISKYNLYQDKKIKIENKNQKIILVVGQVEGDSSLIYGAGDMKNLDLLKKVKEGNRNNYIIYKPHPDVLNGNRIGHIEESVALNYCNQIENKVSIDSLLAVVDEVHTMTSLVGLEALIRNKKVVCYGMPFYAGWGLTFDVKKCDRRKKKLTLNQLIAGSYILYPKYIDPISLETCEIERVLEVLKEKKEEYHNSLFYRSKIKAQNFIYKKYYALLRNILKD